MKIRLLLFFSYQGIFLAWCFKIHEHYFEFTTTDKISLALVALMPLIGLIVRKERKIRGIWVIYLLLPLIMLPLIRYGLPIFYEAWILLYLFPLLTGISILIAADRRPVLLGILLAGVNWLLPYSFNPNQHHYHDLVEETVSTRKGEFDRVIWKKDHWVYYNNTLLISTIDGHMHAEVLVHTSLPLFDHPKVLLIGDEHGLTKKEILKYDCELDYLPYDHEWIQKSEFAEDEIQVINADILKYLRISSRVYEVIIVDLPDPDDLVFKHYYDAYFYETCKDHLSRNGRLITNAGGYYNTSKGHHQIASAMDEIGLHHLTMQALIPTLGHRAWVLACREEIDMNILNIEVPTSWINQEALKLLSSKGKDGYPL